MFRSHSAGIVSLSDVTVTSSVKVTELCEPTGDVMIPNTRALDVQTCVGCPQQVKSITCG